MSEKYQVKLKHNIHECSLDDWCMTQEDFDKMSEYIGEWGTAEIEVDVDPANLEFNYFSVVFSDGFEIENISGYNLEFFGS